MFSWCCPVLALYTSRIFCEELYEMYIINTQFNNPPDSDEGDRETHSHFIDLHNSRFSSSWVLFVSFFSFFCFVRALPSLVSPYIDSHYRVKTRNSYRLYSDDFTRMSRSSSLYSHPPTLIQNKSQQIPVSEVPLLFRLWGDVPPWPPHPFP